MKIVLLILAKTLLDAAAQLTGVVRDAETGRPLAGVVVEVTDLNRFSVTDAEGQYRLEEVPAGAHPVNVHLIGYLPQLLNALVPESGRLEINLSLRSDPVRLPTLKISAPVVQSDTDRFDQNVFPDRSLSAAEVRNNPLVAEPDVFQALDGGEVVLQPESPNGIHIRGGGSDQTGYLLDGIPLLSPYHTAGAFSALNPDAISRLSVTSTSPSPEYSDALSGIVRADTRTPGSRLSSQGSVSSSQLRVTLDGPLGRHGAGFLLSLRSGMPDLVAPKREPSYLRGRSGDWLAKLEAPMLGGRARLLGYNSDDQFNTAAIAEGDERDAGSILGRNLFQWHSRSLGAQWERTISKLRLRILGWSASSEATAEWNRTGARLDMIAARRDQGFTLSLERRWARSNLLAGVRVERSRTGYRVESDSASTAEWRLDSRTPVAAAFAEHTRSLGPAVQLAVGSSLTAVARGLYLTPRAQLQWQLSPSLKLIGNYSRLHQFAQSLRNGESVVGNVFPADLYVGAGARQIPVARSDQGVIALDYRPSLAVHVGVQAFARSLRGLLLAAPEDGEPFSVGSFATGTGIARGASIDLSVTGTRFGLLGSYGWQQVRLKSGHTTFVPDYGATHLFKGGAVLFPTATSSIRFGITGALGRRSTTLSSGLEWEACNLLDRGCEFGGSPSYEGEVPGGTRLPAYLRADLSVRKTWQIGLGRHDGQITLFGTLTNLFDRKNVLTYSRDPTTREMVPIEMRPRAPLVAGLEWQF